MFLLLFGLCGSNRNTDICCLPALMSSKMLVVNAGRSPGGEGFCCDSGVLLGAVDAYEDTKSACDEGAQEEIEGGE